MIWLLSTVQNLGENLCQSRQRRSWTVFTNQFTSPPTPGQRDLGDKLAGGGEDTLDEVLEGALLSLHERGVEGADDAELGIIPPLPSAWVMVTARPTVTQQSRDRSGRKRSP